MGTRSALRKLHFSLQEEVLSSANPYELTRTVPGISKDIFILSKMKIFNEFWDLHMGEDV